jgi:RNA polymerase sigma factor (sigma-70 family)
MDWHELENESVENLISYIRSKNDPSYIELAEAALHAVTFRYRKDLIDKCTIMCRKRNMTDDDAIELANRVFQQIWNYAAYKKEKCPNPDPNICFRRYLYGIANNEIIDLQFPTIPLYDGSEKIISSLISDDADYTPERLAVLKEYEEKLDAIFSKLTPKHKTIYLTYKQYEIKGHNLPKHLQKQLREALGLSQNTVRVYKKEAVDLIEKELK